MAQFPQRTRPPAIPHSSGIDIKTNGIEGEPVFAIGDGYISRIRVSPYGYGRAIYITHSNGFTSVYGHLSRFNAAIEKYVHTHHYLQKKHEVLLDCSASGHLYNCSTHHKYCYLHSYHPLQYMNYL